MNFELPPLPYPKDALEPHVSSRTLDFHYDRHHRGYLEKLRSLVEGTPEAQLELADLVTRSDGAVFESAAQVWNHTFYWNSMTPDGGGEPVGRLGEAVRESFGSFEQFCASFVACAVGHFGSGWIWLTLDPATGALGVESSKDAANPLLTDRVPLLTLDVWEHAYYLDYQNERKRYAESFLADLVNWRFAEENFEKAL